MKQNTLPLLLVALLGHGSLLGEESAPLVVKMRPTHQDLEKRRAEQAGKLEAPTGLVRLEPGEVKPRKREATSLVGRSTVISFGGHWTIVPNGAVLHTPVGLEARVGVKPSGRLLTWADFFSRNRGWIAQQPVEVVQARGEKEISEEVVTHFRKGSQVVVATCHRGPISVKEPVKKEEPTAAAK